MSKLILNPNKKERDEVIKAIKANDGYCPCLLEKNEDTKCACKDKRVNNICHCGLFVEEE